MAKPNAIIITGFGINCEEETAEAFVLAGALTKIVHINDLIADSSQLLHYQILALPGGFSFGDDTGSGNAFANKIKNKLEAELKTFLQRDTLMLGICNGCQVLTNLGIIPSDTDHNFTREVAFTHNDSARYQDRWVHLAASPSPSVFTQGIKNIYLPVAHGEGKFQTTPEVLTRLKTKQQVALRYANSNGSLAAGVFPQNPNGSLDDIAGLTDITGRVLALMPHPERHLYFTQHPQWTLINQKMRRAGQRRPKDGEGLPLFKNAIRYFG